MTIQRAKELLGTECRHMTDDDILEYLQQTGLLCDVLLEVSTNDILQRKKPNVTTKLIKAYG